MPNQGSQTITKKEIVNIIADKTGLTAVDTMNVVQTFMDLIIEELSRGKRFEFREFGVFETKRRKARIARNPTTGELIEVAPRTVVVFKPGSIMKHRVREGGDAMASNDDREGNSDAAPPPPNPWGNHS